MTHLSQDGGNPLAWLSGHSGQGLPMVPGARRDESLVNPAKYLWYGKKAQERSPVGL